ncbi:MAG: glucose-methanol-choline oxidoreductase, partial [Betaproteobacteria bacterium]|nr:glucose-methanol-choline oxidoreductase [Betaproteobacteria bacterium]
PVMSRPNLTVVTNVEVERILFEGRRAVGVRARRNGAPVEYRCKAEVIVCAGAIMSPLLLQQSGIGPGERLRAAGVEVLVDSPDVGRRMLEHLGFAMPHRLRQGESLNGRLRGAGLLMSVLQYGLFRSGILASGPYEIGAFVRSDPSMTRPDVQVYMGAFSMGRPREGLPPTALAVEDKPGITISCHSIRLTSESDMWITAPDGAEPAVINANWLSTPEDQRTMLNMVRMMRRFMTMPALAPYVGEELIPGPGVRTDEQLMDAVKKLVTCAIHATTSCRMGSDERSVVDPQLKVRGTENVRVVDCSVMPGLIAGNTNAPAIALAWRAADLWQDERRRAA